MEASPTETTQAPVTRALLVHIDFRQGVESEEIEEFTELTRSAGATPMGVVTGRRDRPDARLFVGSGKAEEIGERLAQAPDPIDIILFNHSLTPSQERNLEQQLQCRVLDRTGLILDIFAQRAKSFEGRLQVELAQLKHLSTRLIRGWTHLERQKGGIGLRGPGETQLETDRRLLGVRIRQLRQRLDKVQQRRDQSRKSRQRAQVQTLSLVGYTNAGKSTLFNRLTSANVVSADQLFATLDPTLRQWSLSAGEKVVLADTVGFIRHLPHDLIAAFQSTLQESCEADLLLHVIDAQAPNRSETISEVEAVLEMIGAAKVPRIEVYNKADLLAERPQKVQGSSGQVERVWVSAQTGEGIEDLVEAVRARVFADQRRYQMCLPPSAARLRAHLYQSGRVVDETCTEQGNWLIRVELGQQELAQLQKNYALSSADICLLA